MEREAMREAESPFLAVLRRIQERGTKNRADIE